MTDKDGNIVSTDDPEAGAKAEGAARARKERQAALAGAAKRGSADPIDVALFQTVMSEDLRKATSKDGVFPYLRKEFEHDPVIRALDHRVVDRYAEVSDFQTGRSRRSSSIDRGPEFLSAGVYVESFATLEEKFVCVAAAGASPP